MLQIQAPLLDMRRGAWWLPEADGLFERIFSISWGRKSFVPVYARDGLSNPSPGGWIARSSRSKVRLLPLLFEKDTLRSCLSLILTVSQLVGLSRKFGHGQTD